jgi:hypothetical protein
MYEKKIFKKGQNKPMQTELEQVKGFCNWFFPEAGWLKKIGLT